MTDLPDYHAALPAQNRPNCTTAGKVFMVGWARPLAISRGGFGLRPACGKIEAPAAPTAKG